MRGSRLLHRGIRDERGFSLIEMLTALMILLIVLGTLTTLMVSATKSEVDLTRRVQAQQEARLALEMIRRDIHRACKAEHMNLTTGVPFTPAGAHTNIRLTPPVASACPTTTDATTAVTWCLETVTANRLRLRRVVGMTGSPMSCTSAAGTQNRAEADYLTTPSAFTLQHPSGSRAKVNVYFRVDLDPSSLAGGSYRLEDNLVLRNSGRAS